MKHDQLPTELSDTAFACALHGAIQYMEAHDLKPLSEQALSECLRSWVKIKLPEALADAKDAIEAHLGGYAESTFKATIVLAGIEAAKECGFPKGGVA